LGGFEASLGKKLMMCHLNKQARQVHTCNPSYTGGIGKRIAVRGWPGNKEENSTEKTTKAKRPGVMPQVVG
jgi:hypothetical protein